MVALPFVAITLRSNMARSAMAICVRDWPGGAQAEDASPLDMAVPHTGSYAKTKLTSGMHMPFKTGSCRGCSCFALCDPTSGGGAHAAALGKVVDEPSPIPGGE